MIPRGREMMGAEQVVNKFGVSPELFRDYQAIMGDATVRDATYILTFKIDTVYLNIGNG